MPLLVVVTPMLAFFWAVVLTHKLDTWSVAASTAAAAATCVLVWVRDDAPQHVLNWRRGAEGERMTEKTLRPLERSGWKVEHDIQQDGKANLDHIVTAPSGRLFLLETKNLLGMITLDDGVLQARQFDDPDEVYRYTSLARRVRAQAAALSRRLRADTGRRPWVEAVVVIWGAFEAGVVEDDRISYIAGARLRQWLAERARSAPESAAPIRPARPTPRAGAERRSPIPTHGSERRGGSA